MPRSTWKGYLKLSFVSVPVKGYTANTGSDSIKLHQLHQECHSRIKYSKVCPIHGSVPSSEIVSAYEYADDQYVVIDPKELKALRAGGERAVNIEAVVKSAAIDPLYFTEKTYYLLPDGAVGQRPYALIQKSLTDEDRCAIGRAVLYGREELVLIRPVDNLLSLTALKYDAEVVHPQALADELETPSLQKAELELTHTLLKAFVKPKFDLAAYKDEYVEALTELIEAKVAGKKIVASPAAEEPPIINLMEALKKSVAAVGGEAPRRKKQAERASAVARKSAPKRRKSG
ncbi:non-homologous end joining protein Ku [Anatilimnocola floriformis]|uniref:non-homologous end joining protein Ku n=1 Tax=Anatilimnocola floriformis TaxID=2948575 RepID=UPI0020C25E9F|nr:Ku protein [Anatilimnocola floriformis]